MFIFRLIFIIIILNSCITQELNNEQVNTEIKKDKDNNDFYYYKIGDPYYIDDIKYIPKENYKYSEVGRASFFDKRYHGRKTANNEIINITSLIAAHKTLPLPSVVKVTNLENDTSLIVRVNDRGPLNNTDIIMVSRRVAELLNFYDQKYTNVRIEILEDESRQLKLVAESVNMDITSETITAAPTTDVNVTNID